MKTMKRLIATAMTLAMVMALVACGGGKTTTSTSTPAASGGDTTTTQPSGSPVMLDLVTASSGTSWYSYGATLAEILPKTMPKGSLINSIAEGGATSNPIQVGEGAYQMGIGYNLSSKWAYDGESLYTKKYDNLRSIAGYLDTFYYIGVVRSDAGWTDLGEVAANKMPVKISVLPAGNMGNVVTSMIFDYYGMTFEDIEAWGGVVEYADWATSVENIKDGRTDFICHNITQGHAAVTELSSTIDMTFIQFPQEMIDTFVNEKGFSPETLPAGSFKGQDTEIKTFGVTSNLFCTADLDDEVAYNVAKAMCENVADVNAGHKALQRFTAEGACDPAGLGIPLHPGAEKYYKEAGLLK